MYQATVDEWLQAGQAALQGGQTLDTRQAFCTLLLNCTVHPFGFAELVFFFQNPTHVHCFGGDRNPSIAHT